MRCERSSPHRFMLNSLPAVCTFFMARPEISCVPAHSGSHFRASGVEHAMLMPCRGYTFNACQLSFTACERMVHRECTRKAVAAC